MGKTVEPQEKIVQRSIGFPLRQHLFFAEHRIFRPDEFCRLAIDSQIAEIDSKYLPKETSSDYKELLKRISNLLRQSLNKISKDDETETNKN